MFPSSGWFCEKHMPIPWVVQTRHNTWSSPCLNKFGMFKDITLQDVAPRCLESCGVGLPSVGSWLLLWILWIGSGFQPSFDLHGWFHGSFLSETTVIVGSPLVQVSTYRWTMSYDSHQTSTCCRFFLHCLVRSIQEILSFLRFKDGHLHGLPNPSLGIFHSSNWRYRKFGKRERESRS